MLPIRHGLGVAVFAIALSGCYWENWCKTESVSPKALLRPATAKELVDIVAAASQGKERVRMTGSGHSVSDVAITTDVLLTPEQLNQPLMLNRSALRDPGDRLVRVQSGIRISDLNTWLDHHGFALYNMGGYDGQTIAGVMMTATHGSGADYGPMADQVVSLQVVMEGGRMVQIEPSRGITNPSTWKGQLEENPAIPIELIQDDDVFNSARVSIGSMGIVYSVVLRVDQKFWLREDRHLTKWSELKRSGSPLDRILHGLPIYTDRPSPEHWELQYSPYADAKGDHSFLITDRYRSYVPLPEQRPDQRGKPGTDFASVLMLQFGHPLAWILDSFPDLAKTAIEEILGAQEGPYTNVSYKVFNIGVINDAPALGVEMAFDVSQATAAIERSFAIADEYMQLGIPHSAPIAIRFVKPTSAFIAMQEGRKTMMMELIALRDGKNAIPLLSAHQKAYIREFGARPHWGLDLKSLTSEAEARALYPKWDGWKAQYLRFNAHGTFDGKTTDRLGISVHPR